MELEWLGPYQIVGKLGRGGMGIVYEGVHRETGEPAAVKLLSAALAQEEGFRIRFEAEIETLRKLNHPNIVRLFGFGEQEGHLFYAMELVDGNSLEEELRRGRRFDWREAVRIGVDICRALRHAHDRGVIHRDIKPGNLLLAQDGRMKLSDFGIAKLFGNTRLTNAGNVVGTAEYMAPEQAEGAPVDARSDLYSLGAVIYALLARRPMFRGKSFVEVLQKQRFEIPEPIRTYAADAPEELERILSQLLEKQAERRFPNASVLGRRLEALLQAQGVAGETAEAGPEWFGAEEPPAAASPSPFDPPLPPLPESDETPLAATVDRPGGSLPATQQLDELADDDSDTIEGVYHTLSAAPVEPPPSNGHFTPVTEDELDQAEADGPAPALISLPTAALIAALLLIGVAARWLLQPPSADALYGRIAPRIEDNGPDALPKTGSEIAEIEGVIADFLIRYPEDPRAGQLREYDKELELSRLERKFEQQIKGRGRNEQLTPIQQLYSDAISNIELNPTLARTKLQALVDLYYNSEEEGGPSAPCLTLARRRLAQLDETVEKMADDQVPKLRARLAAADALRQSDPDRAKKMYEAIVTLYGDMPWAADLVRQARESAAQSGP